MMLHQGIRNRRIGKWAWALSAEEGLTAVLAERALREATPLSTKVKRRYAAMLEKQRKLLARQPAVPRPAWDKPPQETAEDTPPADDDDV